jgi:uncharacterized protein involved in type VI secretion and phage assembly
MPNSRVPVAVAAVYIDGTVLSPEVMNDLYSLEVDISLDVPDMALITFHDNKLNLVNDTKYDPGKSVEVKMVGEAVQQNGSHPTETSVFKGEIVGLEPQFNKGGTSLFIIRAYDKRHRLTRATKTRVFKQKKHSEIVSEIARENGLQSQVEDTSTQYEHLLQRNQTDLEFLLQMAGHNAYELLCEDTKIIFRKRQTGSPVATLKWGEDLMSFSPRLSAAGQVNEVTVKGWDLKQKQAIVGTAATSSTQPAIGFGKWGGLTAQSAFSAAKYFEVQQPLKDQGEAQKLAAAILDTLNESFVEAEGVCYGSPTIKPGCKVKVENLGAKFNGEYLITSVTHRYSAQEGEATYTSQFRVEGARRRLMMDLLQPVEAKPALMTGLVPALVTNNKDPENLGRVKVKYPWLPENNGAEIESGWVRVVALGAGNMTGFFWLPEVNDEVMIAFEHGDINRPYLLGGVWNSRDKSPETSDNAVAGDGSVKLRTIQTRGGHIFRFTDDQSGSKIELIDSKQGTKIILDAQQENLTIETGNEISHKGKTIKMKGDSGVTVESGSSLTIKGSSISIEASGQLTLKGSTVNIN